jgi:hypothetical protein
LVAIDGRKLDAAAYALGDNKLTDPHAPLMNFTLVATEIRRRNN